MSKSCVFKPSKDGKNSPKLFDEIKSNLKNILGKDYTNIYNKTWQLYDLASSPKFREQYKDSLILNDEGFPTFNSLLDNELFGAIVGTDVQNKILESQFNTTNNSSNDYINNVSIALEFNKKHSTKVASVIVNSEGRQQIQVVNRDAISMDNFSKQYASVKLAQGAEELLRPLGITIGEIVGEEAKYRNGKTDFSRVKEIVDGTDNIIMVSNSMEGVQAIGEELSHLIVGTKRINPLVQRLLNNIRDNEAVLRTILGDKYEAEIEAQEGDMNKVAEEALGQLLHQHLIDHQMQDFNSNASVTTLFSRLRSSILNKYKGATANNAVRIIDEANAAMSELATNIIKGQESITKSAVLRSYSTTVLNDLKDQSEAIVKALDTAFYIENKRKIITNNTSFKDTIQNIINELSGRKQPSADNMVILANYLQYAFKVLYAQKQVMKRYDTLSSKEKFQHLRTIRSFIQSFQPVFDEIYNASGLYEEDDSIFENETTVKIGDNYKKIKIKHLLSNAQNALKTLQGDYERNVIPTFIEFIEPIVGKIRDKDGKVMSLEDILKSSDGDISITDLWLDSMANSSDQFLQILDTIYRKQSDKARLKSISDIRNIQNLMKWADSKGIKSFEWMFEKYNDGNKTGNYIDEINVMQYYKELKELNDRLDKKYGVNPTDTALKNAKKQEKIAWHNKHSIFKDGEYQPIESLYVNKDYKNLSDDQKEFLRKFKEIKESLDKEYNPDKVLHRAIQIRKDSFQRYGDILSNPSTVIDNIKESWKTSLSVREDDDQILGNSKTAGMMAFDGSQFNMLPIMYQNRLSDPNELSTDVFQTLIAYTISTNEYTAIEEVIDSLEIGRAILKDRIRNTNAKQGSNTLIEKIRTIEGVLERPIITTTSNIEKKSDEWFDCIIYKKYYDSGTTFKVPFFNKEVNTTKIIGLLLRLTSTCQLAFNWLSNSANAATGIAMTNIEAAGGQFFTPKELASADAEYGLMAPGFFAELNSRYKTGKLSLFCELFNVKYNFDNKGRETQRPSAMARLFGKKWGYIGQDGGDHWLYSRVAIAMAKKQKVKVLNKNGKYEEMSLWDALKIEEAPENKELKVMSLPKGTIDVNTGKEFSIGDFSRKIGEVSHNLFGIYNDQDRTVAQRYVMGRLIMAYRQWIKPGINYRWRGREYNQTLGTMVEGSYRTCIRLARDLISGKLAITSAWSTLEDYEKANIRKTFTDFIQLVAVCILANCIKWGDDDKKRPWLEKYAEYLARREVHELGNFVPSTIMFREISSTLKSPTVALSLVDRVTSWLSALMSIEDWDNELKSGTYKGHSTLYKRTMRLPIPVLQWMHQMDKATDNIDDAVNFYVRSQY